MVEEVMQTPLTIEDLNIGVEVQGKVAYLAPYGAMIDIGVGPAALLHISQVGRSDFRNIEEVYNVGDGVEAFVLKVDKENRVALTLVKPPELPWSEIKKDGVYQGTVTRIEGYGAFIDIGAERPGMVHVSELADGYVQSPSDVVTVGEEVEVRVIKLNRRTRQIDLSMKTPVAEIEQILEPTDYVPTQMEIAFRRAQDDNRRDDRRKRKNNDRRNRRQDDIIERTLRHHNN